MRDIHNTADLRQKVQQILHCYTYALSPSDNGVMAVVLPHGALFRSGAESHIIKYNVDKLNYLYAVIGLPENL
jgi:type I restriction-modification system DNA methylase subunit